MKFGKQLKAEMVSEWHQYYVDYASLKALIKDMVGKQVRHGQAMGHVTMGLAGAGQTPRADTIGSFTREIEATMTELNRFTAARLQELLDNLAGVSVAVAKLTESPSVTPAAARTACNQAAAQLDELCAAICRLSGFVRTNSIAMEKICKKSDKHLHTVGGVRVAPPPSAIRLQLLIFMLAAAACTK